MRAQRAEALQRALAAQVLRVLDAQQPGRAAAKGAAAGQLGARRDNLFKDVQHIVNRPVPYRMHRDLETRSVRCERAAPQRRSVRHAHARRRGVVRVGLVHQRGAAAEGAVGKGLGAAPEEAAAAVRVAGRRDAHDDAAPLLQRHVRVHPAAPRVRGQIMQRASGAARSGSGRARCLAPAPSMRRNPTLAQATKRHPTPAIHAASTARGARRRAPAHLRGSSPAAAMGSYTS